MRGRGTQHLDSESVLFSRAKNSTLFLFCPNQFREDYVAQTSKTPTHQNSEVFVRSPFMSKWGEPRERERERDLIVKASWADKKVVLSLFYCISPCRWSEPLEIFFAFIARKFWIKQTLSHSEWFHFIVLKRGTEWNTTLTGLSSQQRERKFVPWLTILPLAKPLFWIRSLKEARKSVATKIKAANFCRLMSVWSTKWG